VNVFSTIFALQIKQLHDYFIGIARMDFTLQENNSVFQQQIA
jgi:hypothetical protein